MTSALAPSVEGGSGAGGRSLCRMDSCGHPPTDPCAEARIEKSKSKDKSTRKSVGEDASGAALDVFSSIKEFRGDHAHTQLSTNRQREVRV